MSNILVSTENLSHEDWLSYRQLGLGGSDASVVCGVNRFKSPVELWLEKTGQLPPKDVGEAAYWGNVLEPFVKDEFTKRTGIEIIPVNHILQSEEYPFMLANLDGICQHPDYGTVVFEAKTTGFYRMSEWESDDIPDEYVLQLQHYLAVTGYMGAYVAVLIGGNTFKWKFVERDEELISMLIQLETEFWELVQSNVPPPLDGSESSTVFIKERFPNSFPSGIELPDTASDLIQQYDVACEKADQYTEQKQEAENLLKQMLGEHEAGHVGDRIVTWKSVTQERLDNKAFQAEHPTLYKRYVNQKSHRRFSIKTAN